MHGIYLCQESIYTFITHLSLGKNKNNKILHIVKKWFILLQHEKQHIYPRSLTNVPFFKQKLVKTEQK